ncbi:hypothetical protein L248_0691 [Schleiferilactobacillus shenzhenensis LY-73]|uniref:Bacterial archaeo-eukaryotic release factor family 6 domain-containing protein n=1 Tax=Schleiferilactobacillus shenzhenensis LY-73 TaxID=1231336 RepID=U4TKA5_9LACO|nr:hypothetical protein L248_0691 [Schleiferilactobacillus shenzhenensis LY-73]
MQDVGVHGPFVSLFMPVHREDVTMEKDRAQFKSLVSQAQAEFGERFPDADWRPYGEKFGLILAERQLISGTNTSMAIIAGPDRVYQYFMRLPLDPEVKITENLYVLPIIENDQYNINYDLLALEKESFRLFSVHDHDVKEVDLPESAPTSRPAAIGTELKNGGDAQRSAGPKGKSVFHGSDPKEAADRADTERYFKMVDDWVRANISVPTHTRVILMAVDEVQGEYRKISKSGVLMDQPRVAKMPPQLDKNTLHDIAVELKAELRTMAKNQVKKATDDARSGNRYSAAVPDIARAAVEGRIDTLILKRGASAPGAIDFNHVVDRESEEARANNILNDIAVVVLSYGGHVYVQGEDGFQEKEVAHALLRGRIG